LVIESAPWQYDARVDAVDKNIALVTGKTDVRSRYKDIISIDGNVSEEDMKKIEKYLINPNEKRESSINDKTFERQLTDPKNHLIAKWFRNIEWEEWFKKFLKENGDVAIEIEDIALVQHYFRKEWRDPTMVELLLIGTYWSDHCRHTTFETQIEWLEVKGVEGFVEDFKEFRAEYQRKNREYYTEKGEPEKGERDTFMQLATSSLRFLKDDPAFAWADKIDVSEEDNAASFKVTINLTNGDSEDWIFMFKNETHNSPTNSEPFGGAATCLGWAIRDTLSGRAFTFMAARITGAWDPTEPINETMAGLVSQRALSIGAALGYASYGNQIGLAATQVREYFHPGYKAKRFEMWVVMAAVKEEDLVRKKPAKDDVIIQFGGAVGRDGIGGATVSSKVAGSMDDKKMWAHVQKWNPVEERKFQRLMLNPKFTRLVKKSNDFGAGGVSVALWELSRWMEIDLDRIAKHSKYSGLSDAELMISESQERMSIVVAPEHEAEVLRMIEEENIVWFRAGTITDNVDDPSQDRLVVNYNWKRIVDLSRDFLDTNGVERSHDAIVELWEVDFFDTLDPSVQSLIDWWDIMWAFKAQLSLLVNASQKWLQDGFDSSVWASTILAPHGGKYQTSPQVAWVSKFPTFNWIDSETGIASSHAFNPYLLEQNTYIWGMYSIIETVSKIVAVWGDHKETWLSLQEYFGKLRTDEQYGEVYAGLLGTLKALVAIKVAAIGWKDSMSGSLKLWRASERIKAALKKEWLSQKISATWSAVKSIMRGEEFMNVPPTIVWVWNAPIETDRAVSAEFKNAWNDVLCFPVERDANGIPDFEKYVEMLDTIESLHDQWKILSSSVVGQWGLAHTITNMCLWNKIGFDFTDFTKEYFTPGLWDIVVEIDWYVPSAVAQYNIWETADQDTISFPDNSWIGLDCITIDEAQSIMDKTLNWVWNTDKGIWKVDDIPTFRWENKQNVANILKDKPVAIVPVFPGTNSELDTIHALKKEWFEVRVHVFNDVGTPEEQKRSRQSFAWKLPYADLLVIPGWFSWWDEPGASGIGAVNVLKSKEIRKTLQTFFDRDDTLSVGICNGAQILNKLWVIDEGKITDELQEDDTIITHNERLNHETGLVKNRVTSLLSPFFREDNTSQDYLVNISHGEWNFQVSAEKLERYIANGQIALQYTDEEGEATNKYNGSTAGISAMTSPDGKIIIMMPHPERTWLNTAKNVPGEKLMPIFKNAYQFFTWKAKNDEVSGR